MINNLRFNKKLRFSLLVSLVSVLGACNVYAMNNDEADPSNSAPSHPPQQQPRRLTGAEQSSDFEAARHTPMNPTTAGTSQQIPLIALTFGISAQRRPDLSTNEIIQSYIENAGNN